MTKEELVNEAEKSLDKRLGTYAYIRKQDCYTNYVDGYIDSGEPREKRIAELEEQIEKMKKYGKLLLDICDVMGNDPYMVWRGLEQRVLILWDKSEEEEGLKMAENILDRLLKIKPHEWTEIDEWEIKEK